MFLNQPALRKKAIKIRRGGDFVPPPLRGMVRWFPPLPSPPPPPLPSPPPLPPPKERGKGGGGGGGGGGVTMMFFKRVLI